MWELFGAQCDRKLTRTMRMRSKELLASSPIPTKGVEDNRQHKGVLHYNRNLQKTTHIRSVLYGYT